MLIKYLTFIVFNVIGKKYLLRRFPFYCSLRMKSNFNKHTKTYYFTGFENTFSYIYMDREVYISQCKSEK